jgi:hypothetical protein
MRLATAAAAAVLLTLLVLVASGATFRRTVYVTASPVGGDLEQARSDERGLRVLFLGNSLTYENDMPGLLEQLVASDPSNRPLFAVRYTPGGQMLSQDTNNPTVSKLLHEAHWDYVVLQETTEITALDPGARAALMDGPARQLVTRIRALGAIPLLFATWGNSSDSPFNPLGSYSEMQERVTTNYVDVAERLNVPLVPAGQAWSAALAREPGVALWEADGHHPSTLGAYLDAAVFYAYLYGRDPASSFLGGLSREDAGFLQRIAGETVPPLP